jgi:cytochrome c oxidase subunit 4
VATKTYLHGKHVDYHEVHEHVSPQTLYVKVLAALFVLTGLTYAVSFASLGPASLPVAMIVAFAKAALVCTFFMHLKYDDRYHIFVFLSTIIFVTIFFTFTLFDLNSRPRLNDEQETFFRVNQGADWNDRQRVKTGEAHGEGKADAKADAKAGDAKAGDAKTGGAPPAKGH